jgi:hypothetical protein
MSPGWHSSAAHMASRLENLTALALLVFKIERFVTEMFVRADSSLRLILRFAIITSRFTIIIRITVRFCLVFDYLILSTTARFSFNFLLF